MLTLGEFHVYAYTPPEDQDDHKNSPIFNKKYIFKGPMFKYYLSFSGDMEFLDSICRILGEFKMSSLYVNGGDGFLNIQQRHFRVFNAALNVYLTHPIVTITKSTYGIASLCTWTVV